MRILQGFPGRCRDGGLLVLLLGVAIASAHDGRVDLAFWGNFGRDTARCQRVISRAAEVCVKSVLESRLSCLAAQAAGETCDTQAAEASVQAARERTRATIARACGAHEVQVLRYQDVEHAGEDAVAICRQLETAAVSAVYGPALVGGSVAAVDDAMQSCLDVTAAEATRYLRFAIRAHRHALDRIAASDMSPAEKRALVQRAEQRIARRRTRFQQHIAAVCPNAEFRAAYRRSADGFLEDVGRRGDCLAEAVYVQSAVTCPASVCGNGMQEAGEECDDGNDLDDDGCRHDCLKTDCEVFPTTYDLIQRAIFENHGCTNDACHGNARSGGLDLRAGVSYQNLIDVPVQTVLVPGLKRIDPGSKENSLLWINLAAKTFPDQWQAPLRPMPSTGEPLSADEIEALRLWIEQGGAARDASVAGTAELLDACLPEPRPAEIEPLPPPAAGEGVQLHMPVWTLKPDSESEVCFASYYDFSGQIPPELLSADGKRFRYKKVDIRQDPLSHHLIVDLYRGPEAADDPVWGRYSCKEGPRAGEPCNPLHLGFCGPEGECATDPDPTAIACIGFGPQTGLSTLTGGGFAFAQETAAEFRFPGGVYDEIPIKGVVLWNSHAFNLTRRTGKMEAWVNVYFPAPDEQVHRQVQIFNARKIFWTDTFPPFPLPELAPFEQREVCHIHVFGRQNERFFGSDVPENQTVHLFELSGHMHEHGKRFQILRGSFTCKGGAKAGAACSPFNASLCPDGACTEDGGRDPQQSLLYTNFIYNDPVVVRFDDPIVVSGSASVADRSLTYCALYDNGAPPNLQSVKRQSTSPPPGTIFGIPIGGPCATSKTRCIGGPQHNQLCGGNHAVCDSSPGAGDGDCDACPLTGGFRTKDEMFILFGNFWLQ